MLYFLYHDCPEFQLLELQLTKKHLNYRQIVYWNNDTKKGCEFLVKLRGTVTVITTAVPI